MGIDTTPDIAMTMESNASSEPTETVLEKPANGFSTPVHCRRKLRPRRAGKNNSDNKTSAKLAILTQLDNDETQGKEGPSMSEVLALHEAMDDNKSIQSAPAKDNHRGNTSSDSRQNAEEKRIENLDSPSATTADETLSIQVSPTGSVLSRYGKPEDYIQNTPSSASRRSWKHQQVPSSAPAGVPRRVSSLKNIRVPFMDSSDHSCQRLESVSSHGGGSRHRPPPMTSSSGAGASYNGYGKPDGFLGTPSQRKKSWKPKRVSDGDGTDIPNDLPPAFRSSLQSPRSPPRRNLVPHSRKVEPIRVMKKEKTNLSPSKLKRKWPPTTSKVDTKIISNNRVKGVVPDRAVKNRRTNFEKTWKETEKITYGSNHAKSNRSRGNFSEDDAGHNSFGSFGSVESRLSLNVSIRIQWGGSTFLTTEGRPMYFEDVYPIPPGLGDLLEDRFASMKADGTPIKPRRQPSLEWDDECIEQEIANDSDSNLCPDIWITPMDGEVDVDADPGHDLWRVRRLWNVDDLDEHEVEHTVRANGLVDVVKILSGVPDEEAQNGLGEVLTYEPECTLWRAKTVYDVDGEIDESSETQDFSEEMIRNAVNTISAERREAQINAKFSYGEMDGIDDEEADEWNGQRIKAKESSENVESSTAKFIHGSGCAAEEDDDDEWNGKRPEKPDDGNAVKPDARFLYGAGDAEDDDDEWNGKRPEKPDDGNAVKPDARFSYGAGDAEDDDDEWNGKRPEKPDDGNAVKPDARFSYGAGDAEDDDDEWNGKQPEKPDDGNAVKPDARFSYGAGDAEDDDDDEWNGKRPEKPDDGNAVKPDARFSYGAGDAEDDDDEWNGKRPEKHDDGDAAKTNARFTYGAGGAEEDNDEWNGAPAEKTNAGTSADNPSGGSRCIYGDGENDGEEDDEWNGKQSKMTGAKSDVSDSDRHKSPENPPLAPSGNNDKESTPRVSSYKKKGDWKHFTSADTSKKIKSKKGKSDKEQLPAEEGGKSSKEKVKKKKKKKKEKDYDHGTHLSDLLSPPPMKMFHDEYY